MGFIGRRKDGLAVCWYVGSKNPFQIPYIALYTGPDAPAHISSMAMDGDAVWITSGIYAIRYLRGKEVSLFFTFLKSGSVEIVSGVTTIKST